MDSIDATTPGRGAGSDRGGRISGDERRRALIRAAHDLLVERGFEGLRVRDIAALVGVNIATLHHHFPTKEDLVRGVVDGIVRDLDRVPAPGSAPDALPPREALHAHLAHVLGQMRDAPDRFVLLNELFARAARDAELGRVLAATDASWRAYLVPLFEAGVARGDFRPDLDSAAAADAVTSFLKGLTLQPTLSSEDARRAADEMERWIVGGADAA